MILISVVAIWLLVNLGYRFAVAWRIANHESTVAWTDQGVHPAGLAASYGSGDTAILLVHGINDTPEVWDRFAPELAQLGYYVRAMRLPGFGQSTADYGSHDHNEWIAAVADELESLHQNHDRVVLVGHSLGGAVSIGTARKHADLIDALVLLAPAVGVSNERSPILPTETWQRIGGYALPFVDVTESPFPPDALDADARHMQSRTRFVPVRVINELFRLIHENEHAASDIKIPCMIVVAAEDQVIDKAAAERFSGELAGPHRFEAVEESAHMIQRDYRWRDVVDLVSEWTDEHAAAISEP